MVFVKYLWLQKMKKMFVHLIISDRIGLAIWEIHLQTAVRV